jgi:hypothetical protein
MLMCPKTASIWPLSTLFATQTAFSTPNQWETQAKWQTSIGRFINEREPAVACLSRKGNARLAMAGFIIYARSLNIKRPGNQDWFKNIEKRR